MNYKEVKFDRSYRADFFKTLSQRVNNYFKENNISRYGNGEMVVKTVVMLSLYIIPYIVMVSGAVTGVWGIFALWVTMGLGAAGIGLCIMHDANHGAYSKKLRVNKILGMVLNMVGGSAVTWKIQHNVLHHSFTNIDGVDEDISPGKILRFSPHQPRFKIHKLQFIYAWFFYGLMTLAWVTIKDFKQLVKYDKLDLLKGQGRTFGGLLTELIVTKVIYYTYSLVIPIMVLDISWWLILIFFFTMHFIAGFILSCIFQSAHVVDETTYPLPDENGNVKNSWAIHQLMTTANFARDNKLLSWCVGGLNYQVEHHLFPNICHIHYKNLSKIVEQTAHEFDLPYYNQPTFLDALKSHTKMLKQLGKATVEVASPTPAATAAT